MGGGKGQTSTSSVSIPPQVLAEYQSVNNKANTTAQQPFTPYSSDPNAFVAPLTGTQQAGIANTNAAVGTAQPYYDQATGQLISAQNSAVPFYGQAQGDVQGAQTIGDLLGSSSYGAIAGAQAGAQPYNAAAGTDYQSAYNSAQPYNAGATGLAIAGAGAVDPSQLNSQAINQYLSPYLGTVLQGTAGILNQQNQQQQAGQLGNAINQGAFGGDRAGIAAANLEQQQNLANSQIYSGILNQGYNTALSTAEGQQQLGLGAAQANRAALQNASTQIQGLGQQQYSQGMGLGTAQQGLGQQTYAQGANTAAQLAALGQQQFGQGITAAGQEAGLGAGLYGMGSNTSQGLANLGTASQTAALQGAQAQLGAGQVEQQTQQAGDTALYNQFLQQQSYPFQVDQFLANIAEGTGALSGSTTTTTQPGGFFSDERLKENIRPIGKTFDGQKIYAYNYKGDKRTQVGLIAQEVEKKHPEAVGGHMGFKTVDYGVATDKSAERGKFAAGGLTKAYGGGLALPGVDPNYISALLQAQNQSYAPFGNSGLYGGQAGSAPRGGSSYVPAANLPVSQLQVAHPAAAPESGLTQIKQIADLGDMARKEFAKSKNNNTDNDNDTDNGVVDAGGDASVIGHNKRGGRIHRASGGANDDTSPEDLYDDSQFGPGLKIPNDHPTAKLQTAQPPQQSGSGLGDILGIAKDVIPFLATGGRAGFADGGSPDDDPSWLDSLKQAVAPITDYASTAGSDIASAAKKATQMAGDTLSGVGGKNLAAIAEGSILPSTIAPSILSRFSSSPSSGSTGSWAEAPAAADVPTKKPYATGIGSVSVPLPPAVTKKALNKTAGLGAATIPAPHGYASGNPGDNTPYLNKTELDAINDTGQPSGNDVGAVPSSGLAGANLPATGGVRPDLADAAAGDPADSGAGLSGITPTNRLDSVLSPSSATPPPIGSAPSASGHGIADRILHPNGRPDLILPILQGIAAMGTAPTRHLGVALAAGLGAGTNAYLGNQQKLAEIAQTQASGQASQAHAKLGTTEAWLATHPRPFDNATLAPGPDPITGNSFVGPDGSPAHWTYGINYTGPIGGAPTTGTGTTAGSAPSQQFNYLGDAGKTSATNEKAAYWNADPAVRASQTPMLASIASDADKARSAIQSQNLFATSLAANNEGFLQPGINNGWKTTLVNKWNDVARTAGQPNLQIDPGGATEQAIADKMSTATAAMKEGDLGQRSFATFSALAKATANGSMPRDAALHMIANDTINNQRAIDLNSYVNEYDKASQASGNAPNSFLVKDPVTAFGNDHSSLQYQHETGALFNIMRDPKAWPALQSELQSGDPAKVAHANAILDKVVGPNFHRIFSGGS